MKHNYTQPQLEVLTFGLEDIMTSSASGAPGYTPDATLGGGWEFGPNNSGGTGSSNYYGF